MPLDAICMQAVVRETAAQIENTRIEKIQQPARDQVILLLRGGRDGAEGAPLGEGLHGERLIEQLLHLAEKLHQTAE